MFYFKKCVDLCALKTTDINIIDSLNRSVTNPILPSWIRVLLAVSDQWRFSFESPFEMIALTSEDLSK